MNRLEDAREFLHNAIASVLRLRSRCTDALNRNVLEYTSPTFDATLGEGLVCALITCVNASIPLMYWLWTFDVSCVHAPVWYTLLLLINLTERKLPGKMKRKIMFSAFMGLMSVLGIYGTEYALFMCLLCFRIEMRGVGLIAIMWQMRVEVNIYGNFVLFLYKSKMVDLVPIIKGDDMIWNPFTFMWCSLQAFNFSIYEKKYGIQRQHWTRIVSYKRALFALNVWRFMALLAFYVIPKVLYFVGGIVYSIPTALSMVGENFGKTEENFEETEESRLFEQMMFEDFQD